MLYEVITITEELWQFLKNENDVESIVIAKWPEAGAENADILTAFEDAMQVVTNTRTVRQEKNIPQRDKLSMSIIKHGEYNDYFDSVIKKLCNLESIESIETKPDLAAGFIVKSQEYFIPIGNLINKDEEIKKLQDELKYAEGFLRSVTGKS